MIAPKRASRTVRVSRHRDGSSSRAKDALAVEEPLEIRISWDEGSGRRVEPLAVTMRTPGDDFELVAGFLHGEGVLTSPDAVKELTYCRGAEEQLYNIVEARLQTGVPYDPERVRRNVYTTSSCGVCGKASLEAVEATGCELITGDDVVVDAELVPRLPDLLRSEQAVFERTGGLHAAGLFSPDGTLHVVREDVGRHNAVDKVLGRAFLDRKLPGTDRVLVVSGRASFELVQKSVLAGVPMLVAVGAPSSLAVDLARRFHQTLIGFARGGGFNVYTHPERVR